MDDITNAKQLLAGEQDAIVLFTSGDHFEVKQNGNGSTGHWKVDSDMECDKVIVYYRKGTSNEVYIADFIGTKNSPDRKRQVILFKGAQLVGKTTSNWQEFANGGQNPVQVVFGD